MQEIVGIRFKKIGKIYFFDANGINLKKGQNAIVENADKTNTRKIKESKNEIYLLTSSSNQFFTMSGLSE